jgi:hypothetical protein
MSVKRINVRLIIASPPTRDFYRVIKADVQGASRVSHVGTPKMREDESRSRHQPETPQGLRRSSAISRFLEMFGSDPIPGERDISLLE